VPGYIDDVDPGLVFKQKQGREQLAALPVQKVFVPVPLDELRNKHGNLSTRVFAFELMNVGVEKLGFEDALSSLRGGCSGSYFLE
jgi:hypothetical protein